MALSEPSDGLEALIADIGNDIVIDGELLEGCSVAPDELDEMDEDQAATVAAHVFVSMFEHSVQEPVGVSAEPEEGFGAVLWTRSIRDRARPFGDLLVSFFPG